MRETLNVRNKICSLSHVVFFSSDYKHCWCISSFTNVPTSVQNKLLVTNVRKCRRNEELFTLSLLMCGADKKHPDPRAGSCTLVSSRQSMEEERTPHPTWQQAKSKSFIGLLITHIRLSHTLKHFTAVPYLLIQFGREGNLSGFQNKRVNDYI